jgi:Zn-dependent metalloprotease
LKNAGEWNQIPAALARQLGYEGPATELLLYPHNNTLRLVYAVTVCPTISESWMYFIDANTGESLDRLQLHRYDDYLAGAYSIPKPKTISDPNAPQTPLGKGSSGKINQPNDGTPKILDDKPKGSETHSVSFVNVAGKDLLNRDRIVQGYQAPDGTIFPLSSESNFRDTPADRLPRRPNGGHIVLDANGVNGDNLGNVELTVRTTTSGQPFSPQVTSALAETDSVLRYFRTKFNRTSWDDKGSFIQTIINIGGGQAGQAWWNPGLIAQGYGPGDPGEGGAGWRDLHLVGHEVGHAYNTPGRLNYGDDQGGAIEEHLANFWGWMVNSSSFFVFPVLWPPTSSAAWHMSAEPDSCGDANKNLPRSMTDFLPRTDPRSIERKLQFPHYNGPIVDRAAWFVVNKYGRDTTSQIWHRALINYITQDTRFGAFRRAIVQSTQDLFPTNTTLLADVNAAFDRVGITLTTGAETSGRIVFAGKEQAQTQAIRSNIAFSTQSGRIGLYDPATRRATYFTGNDAVVRTQGGRSRLSAPRTGNTNRLYFVNAQGRLAFLDLLQGRVTVFANLQLRQAGDILSAAISPDERTVAMTSQYDNDAAVYIATITGTGTASAVRRVSLERLAAEGRKTEGKQVSGIRYPDALAWSPDSRNPELVLDAMSSLRVGKDSVQFWGLYYASFQTPTAPFINDVFPPQPGYDLGFPTFSSNNPNTLAFGETSDGTTDMYIANFDKSEDTGYLNIPKFVFTGGAITDADQATFSPDDAQLAMVSPASPRNLVLYTFARTGAAAQLQAVTLDSTVNRPFWANLDVATSVRDDGDANAALLGLEITPNPASEQASVRFMVQQPASRVTLKVYTILGQEVMTLSDGMLAQGNHTLPFSTEALSAGVYVCRLQVGSSVGVVTLRVVR